MVVGVRWTGLFSQCVPNKLVPHFCAASCWR